MHKQCTSKLSVHPQCLTSMQENARQGKEVCGVHDGSRDAMYFGVLNTYSAFFSTLQLRYLSGYTKYFGGQRLIESVVHLLENLLTALPPGRTGEDLTEFYGSLTISRQLDLSSMASCYALQFTSLHRGAFGTVSSRDHSR